MKNLIIAGIVLLIVSCSNEKPGTVFWVNSYQIDCVGVGPMRCMLIQKGETREADQWQTFYSKIEGFDYEPGYIYKLLVKEEEREDVPADASSIKYSLIEVLEKKEDPTYAIGGEWEAFKMYGSVIKLPRMRGAGVLPNLTVDIHQKQISGTDGCNRYTGKITTLENHSLTFGPIAVTPRMCPDMTIANTFNAAMGDVAGFKTENDKLFLTDSSGKTLLEFNRPVDPKTKLSHVWQVDFLGDTPVGELQDVPHLTINGDKMELTGSDGCNNFMGKITQLSKNNLQFGPQAGTRKMCPDMAIPDQFNQAISSVRHYLFIGEKLVLLDENDQKLMLLQQAD